MIERFNFYDIYGYLVPGLTWLFLLALPFHVIFQFSTASIPELTAVLAVAYVVGHLLAGLAHGVLPSDSHDIGLKDKEGKPILVPRSVAVLSDRYPYKDKVQEEVKGKLAQAFNERFKFNPLDPTAPFIEAVVRRMFFLCRTSLAQSKAAGYVEQYQGMSSLTGSLSFATWTAAAYYAVWAVTSAAIERASRPGRWPLPLLIVVAGAAAAVVIRRAIDHEAKDKTPVVRFNLRHPESALLTSVLLIVAFVSARWYPLSHRASLGFAAGAGVLWLAALRFRTSSDALSSSWIQAIYEDFLVLQTAPKTNKDDDEKR